MSEQATRTVPQMQNNRKDMGEIHSYLFYLHTEIHKPRKK